MNTHTHAVSFYSDDEDSDSYVVGSGDSDDRSRVIKQAETLTHTDKKAINRY